MSFCNILKERMTMLSVSNQELSDKTLIDIDIINDLLADQKKAEDIDDFDLNVLACALYCPVEYFFDKQERKNDVMSSCYNRGVETSKSALAKVKIQKLVKDIVFLREVLD